MKIREFVTIQSAAEVRLELEEIPGSTTMNVQICVSDEIKVNPVVFTFATNGAPADSVQLDRNMELMVIHAVLSAALKKCNEEMTGDVPPAEDVTDGEKGPVN